MPQPIHQPFPQPLIQSVIQAQSQVQPPQPQVPQLNSIIEGIIRTITPIFQANPDDNPNAVSADASNYSKKFEPHLHQSWLMPETYVFPQVFRDARIPNVEIANFMELIRKTMALVDGFASDVGAILRQ